MTKYTSSTPSYVPDSQAAPPPPPPPPSKHPPPPPLDFPPLDLADLSFDLSQLPELPLDGSTPDSGTGQDSFMEDVMNDHMDVDMDVADWLETLPPDNRKQNLTPYRYVMQQLGSNTTY